MYGSMYGSLPSDITESIFILSFNLEQILNPACRLFKLDTSDCQALSIWRNELHPPPCINIRTYKILESRYQSQYQITVCCEPLKMGGIKVTVYPMAQYKRNSKVGENQPNSTGARHFLLL